ncbi:hypothetical protein BZL30_8795 [Mycobacterium kansasii]|uniref:Uncharacterized protein n=1 Tax=Mycobacterium kansasii TaxID=1768 RepID=A0A1V3WFI0_MYCKA|nr:hypothetical protein BZL30_8795 [Mycobacterium kansasii]
MERHPFTDAGETDKTPRSRCWPFHRQFVAGHTTSNVSTGFDTESPSVSEENLGRAQ